LKGESTFQKNSRIFNEIRSKQNEDCIRVKLPIKKEKVTRDNWCGGRC